MGFRAQLLADLQFDLFGIVSLNNSYSLDFLMGQMDFR